MPPSGAVTPERILQMSWGFAPPLVIEAALQHKVFDILDAGPRSVDEVATQSGASVRGLTAIMEMLLSLGLLARSDGKFSLTPESSAFLVSTRPSFHGGMVRHCSQLILSSWLRVSESVATGKPSSSVNVETDGGSFFQELVVDLLLMNFAASQTVAQHLLPQLRGDANVLDLAAGSGVWSLTFLQQSPTARATAVDWAEVIPVTKKIAAKFGVDARYTFLPGDIGAVAFGSGYNVATLGHILHSEGEQRALALLRKTFAALAPGGTIVIPEFLVNDDRSGPAGSLIFAVNMLVMTDNGNAFTLPQISTWLTEAGFTNIRTLPAPAPSPIILAAKP